MSNSFILGRGNLLVAKSTIEDEKVGRGMTSPINFMPDEDPSFYEKHATRQTPSAEALFPTVELESKKEEED